MSLIGRFAPSPTGPLHMGSLLTALASFLDIKQRGGRWYIRIEDLDPPRQDAAAIPKILSSLQAHSLVGDLPVDYQSKHHERYERALAKISSQVFYCDCPRRTLAEFPIYPGKCRSCQTPRPDTAWRLRVSGEAFAVQDDIQATIRCQPEKDFGDFIVRRRDGLWAYNFATAVDDGMDVSHVLRGLDLLHVTPTQVYVMNQLGLTAPSYAHLPVLCFADGTKLSKQTHAPALDDTNAAENLHVALQYLGLEPPNQPRWTTLQWLSWGLEHWSLARIPKTLKPFLGA